MGKLNCCKIMFFKLNLLLMGKTCVPLSSGLMKLYPTNITARYEQKKDCFSSSVLSRNFITWHILLLRSKMSFPDTPKQTVQQRDKSGTLFTHYLVGTSTILLICVNVWLVDIEVVLTSVFIIPANRRRLFKCWTYSSSVAKQNCSHLQLWTKPLLNYFAGRLWDASPRARFT